MRITKNSLKTFALTAVVVGLAAPAFAGGPLAVCDCGVPFLWPNGGTNIPFNPDQGNLAILDNAMAVQAVEDAFQAWEDVPTSTASYVNAGLLPVDVTLANFGMFFFTGVPDGLSPIVFDDNGEIFDFLFGAGSGILGFAGPDVLTSADCSITEGAAFLNGPAIGTLEGLLDLMVHEFGHYTNLAHTIINGQQFIGVGDTSGPEPNNTFGFPPFPDGVEVIATMYPFLFGGVDQLTRTPDPDDRAILSTLYPEPTFFTTTGTITGSILAPNGTSPITGVNVIARNVADPFGDAVSAISSDFTDDFSACCPVTGVYTINGLTPGETYAVYVDEIEAGGFSTPPASPLPGPEDFYNGVGETGDSSDDPSVFEGVTTSAGVPNTGIDILFNGPNAGDALAVGDDGAAQLFMPFNVCFTGQSFDSVFVNANGNLTFGAADGAFLESAGAHLDGPPRVAGLFDDLNPSAGGTVSFSQTTDSFTVSWADVPEFPADGANSFDITLHNNGSQCAVVCSADNGDSEGPQFRGTDVTVDYGDLSATDGLAGVSAGLFATNGIEPEVDLTSFGNRKIKLKHEAAGYELFDAGDNDLANTRQRYEVRNPFRDRFEDNNTFGKGKQITLPFASVDTKRAFTGISPQAADVDYFKIRRLKAGQTMIAEVLRGQIDSVLGVFEFDEDGDADSDSDSDATGTLLAFDDDGGNGLLSRLVFQIPADGEYAVAVSFFGDLDFDGEDPGQGAPFDLGRYILSIEVIDGTPLALGDDDFAQVGFGFDFPFQGTNYNDVFVNANGNLTFGSEDTTVFNWEETVTDFLAGPPRVSPMWDDLSPNLGGLVFFKDDGNCMKVTFREVPEFGGVGMNTFAASFDSSGNVQFDYGALTAPDGLAGITEGPPALDPGESDLGSGGPFSTSGTTYENFDGLDNDLSGATVIFGSATSCD